eukprot:jgi/Mesvir1/10584/Mv21799-RA.1
MASKRNDESSMPAGNVFKKRREEPRTGVNCSTVRGLGEKLLEGRQHVNNAVTLIAVLTSAKSGGSDADMLESIRCLLVFFSARLRDGEIPFSAAKKAEPSAQADLPPEVVYQNWLRVQYKAFTKALVLLMKRDGLSPAVQIEAMSAVMELARLEKPGSFSNELYAFLLQAMVASREFNGSVLGALVTKYLHYSDVRFHTLGSLRRIAAKRLDADKAGVVGSILSSDDEDEGEGEGRGSRKRSGAATGPVSAATPEDTLSTHHLARNLFDVLSNVPGNLNACMREDDGEPPTSKGSKGDAKGDRSPALRFRYWCSFDAAAQQAAIRARTQAAAKATETPAGQQDGGKGKRKERKGKKEPVIPAKLTADFAELPEAPSLPPFAQSKPQQRALGDAWLAFLKLPLPEDVYKKVLACLHTSIMPFMPNPVLLSDFLTNSYNVGGLVSILALNSLFVLINEHGLEYEDFYPKLYALVDSSVFHAKYRARFFQLLDLFLKSTHLPAYVVASFAKRLSRLALTAPPAGATLAIAFVHNLLRRHPACGVLVHRAKKQAPASTSSASGMDGEGAATASRSSGAEGQAAHDSLVTDTDAAGANGAGTTADASARADGLAGAGGGLTEDPFVMAERDLRKTRALESSLWEVDSLRRHYCPTVPRFVPVLERDLSDRTKTSEFGMKDFTVASYSTLFSEEVDRKVKKVPLAFYSRDPGGLFLEPAAAGEAPLGSGEDTSLAAEKGHFAGWAFL